MYLWVALALNLPAILMYALHDYLPPMLKNNNLLYNLSSIARVIFFSWYIFLIRWPDKMKMLKNILLAYLIVVALYFAFLWSPLKFSSHLHSAESIIILALCSAFFLSTMTDDSEINWLSDPSFLVCVGIGLLEAVTLFIYLFFWKLLEQDKSFGLLTMTLRKLIYMVLCILFGIAIYRNRKHGERSRQQQLEYN